MKIHERYSTARNTSNLKSDPRSSFSPADVLTAVGMTAQEHEAAVMLWGVTFQGRTSAKHALVERMAADLTRYMLATGQAGDPRRIAQEVLAWWLYGRCDPCGGRGYELIPGTPTQSDVLCHCCHGTGKVAFPVNNAHEWMRARMEKWTGIAGSDVMRRLNVEMDL